MRTYIRKSKKCKTDTDIYDLEFIFKNCKLIANFDPDYYDDEEKSKIEEIIKTASKEIHIDKTYVAFKGSNFEKTFIKEQGWNDLCRLVITTDLGRLATRIENEDLMVSYALMMICYMYQFLTDLGYDSEHLCLELSDKSKFIVQAKEDTYNEWRRYKGRWQDNPGVYDI